MRFNPRIWFPIAVVGCLVNVGAVWFAAVPAEPLHATIHAALAVGFGLWAQHLRRGPRNREVLALPEGLEVLETEVSQLRQELSETQERLDFAERVLAQGAETRRVDPR